MAFIPVPNCVEIRIDYENNGRPYHTVLNVTSAVAPTVTFFNAVAAQVIDAIVSNTLSWMSSQFVVTNIHGTDLSSSSGFSADSVTGTGSNVLPFTPVGATSEVTANNALVTTLRTASRGRSFRGRNYWPGILQAQVDNNTVISHERVVDQQIFVSDLLSRMSAVTGCTPVIVSRHADKAPRTVGVTTEIVSSDTNNIVDSQRRRTKP